MKNIAIIVAGGVGSRMGSDIPKQYLKVNDKPILYYTIQSFITNKNIDGIIIVIGESDRDLYDNTILLFNENSEKILGYCTGGKNRSDSVYNGLIKAKEYQPTNVLIHDGARPFVHDDIIDNIIDTLNTDYKAVLVGIPVVDTLQYCENNHVQKVIDRKNVWLAQTPQSFDFHMILKAYTKIINHDITLTDDISVWKEFYNHDTSHTHDVKILSGSDSLFKVTVKSDLQKVKNHILLQNRHENAKENTKSKGRENMRIHVGSGFDVHGFDESKPLGQKICGVMIENSLALKGHSDADVGLHAIVDSLLGAIAEGDIGLHFPPSEMKWKGADSKIFIDFAVNKLAEVKASINNIDITIMCETPKITPHRNIMQEKVAELLHIEKFQVNIKGTTTEKLGFLGRKEGIAVHSTVLISLEL